MERTDLIICRDLSLGYEGQSVLSHLNLRVRTGDYLCVVGDNGSGKSTLLRGLLGLLPPLAGAIERAAELERGAVGYLPQQTKALLVQAAGGGGPLRLPEPEGAAVLLHRRPALPGADEPGEAGGAGAPGQELPGPLRRPAAAGAPGAGLVRRKPSADFGRARHRAGPRRRPGPL